MPYFRSYSFSDLLRVTNKDNNSFEHVNIDNHDIILLKGNFALERLNACLHHYDKGTQKGSPLDTIFLIYGPTVSSPFTDSRILRAVPAAVVPARFFCGENQHVLSPMWNCRQKIPPPQVWTQKKQDITARYLPITLKPVISAGFPKFSKICDSFFLIVTVMYRVSNIFWQIFFWRSKQAITHTYSNTSIPFVHNAAIIELIENKYYLYEILLYFNEQFDMIMRAIGSNSSASVFDDILNYINHNYASQLKLETLASTVWLQQFLPRKTVYPENGCSFQYLSGSGTH